MQANKEGAKLPEEEYLQLDDELLAGANYPEISARLDEVKPPVPKWWQSYQPILITLIVVLIATASFGLGRLTKIKESKVPLRVEYRATSEDAMMAGPTTNPNPVASDGAAVLGASSDSRGDAAQGASPGGQVVGSKNSTKYHFPWCGGAKQISPQNLVTFASAEAARAAGYTPAANCKGLK